MWRRAGSDDSTWALEVMKLEVNGAEEGLQQFGSEMTAAERRKQIKSLTAAM